MTTIQATTSTVISSSISGGKSSTSSTGGSSSSNSDIASQISNIMQQISKLSQQLKDLATSGSYKRNWPNWNTNRQRKRRKKMTKNRASPLLNQKVLTPLLTTTRSIFTSDGIAGRLPGPGSNTGPVHAPHPISPARLPKANDFFAAPA